MERARAKGDLPRDPVVTGFGVVAGGLLGMVAAAAATANDVMPLAQAAFGALDAATAWEKARGVALIWAAVPVLGALSGLVGAQFALGAVDFRARARVRAPRTPGGTVVDTLGALAVGVTAPVLAWAVLPSLLPAPDAGFALLRAPVVVGFGALGLALPWVVIARARAVRSWRERVDPQPPPRRSPDEADPAVRARVRGAMQDP
jgi:hypothetical protein